MSGVRVAEGCREEEMNPGRARASLAGELEISGTGTGGGRPPALGRRMWGRAERFE